MPTWFIQRYFLPQSLRFSNISRLYELPQENDPGYHISYKGQQVIANNIYKLIKQKNMI
jgi:hypothetical protein